MPSVLLDRVRTTSKTVVERAKHVRIRDDLLTNYAQSLPVERALSPALDPACHYVGHGDDTVAFVLTLDAINFGSGYFPHLRKRPGCSGYVTIATSLTDTYRSRGPLSAEELAKLTPQEAAVMFGQDLTDEPIAELMRLHAGALNRLGRFLIQRFASRFMGVIEAARQSAERLVHLLIEMPEFNDVAHYGEPAGAGKPGVAFYKRAQLTAADLALAFQGEGPGEFADLDRLTIFADNLVPHVLRTDGILEYDDTLKACIDAGELIPAGSPQEIEIRACAVHAAELIVQQLQKLGHAATAMGLDYLLWNRGQQPAYKGRPRHRTRTVFY